MIPPLRSCLAPVFRLLTGARWRVGRTLRRAPLTVPELKPAVEPPPEDRAADTRRRLPYPGSTVGRSTRRSRQATRRQMCRSRGSVKQQLGHAGPEYPSVAFSARSSAIACPGAQTAAGGRYSDGRPSTFGSSTSSPPDRGKASLLTNCRNVIRVVLTTHVHNNKRWRRAFGRSDFNSRHATACRLVASHMH
jgi:hypothetical protein